VKKAVARTEANTGILRYAQNDKPSGAQFKRCLGEPAAVSPQLGGLDVI
jgi:hypothetical protein